MVDGAGWKISHSVVHTVYTIVHTMIYDDYVLFLFSFICQRISDRTVLVHHRVVLRLGYLADDKSEAICD